ncbi:MAG: hypothetical protein ACI8RD_000546 [Bacillariaceae sp.]|jgi:hypothetical protein
MIVLVGEEECLANFIQSRAVLTWDDSKLN